MAVRLEHQWQLQLRVERFQISVALFLFAPGGIPTGVIQRLAQQSDAAHEGAGVNIRRAAFVEGEVRCGTWQEDVFRRSAVR